MKDATLTFVVLLILNVPRQAKVSQLHGFRTGDQHVPNGDVSVEETQNKGFHFKCTLF